MVYGSLRKEKEYEQKGYFMYKSSCKYFDDAEKIAKGLRERGYYAVAMEYSTMVPGLHNYAVWAKKKGGSN